MSDAIQAIAELKKVANEAIDQGHLDWANSCAIVLRMLSELLAELDAAKLNAEKLRRFAYGVMGDWPDVGGLDGCELQDLGVRHGLLVGTMRTEPFGEFCECSGYGEFPMECFTKTPLLTGKVNAARAQEAK
jgi:hypothetical protein